ARACHRLGRGWWRGERMPEARAAFERARTLLEDRPRADLARVLVDLGSLLVVNLHRHSEGIAQVRTAVALAEQLSDEAALAAANRALGNLLVRGNDLVAGIPLIERALALATAVDDPIEAAECCACLAPAYFWQGAF